MSPFLRRVLRVGGGARVDSDEEEELIIWVLLVLCLEGRMMVVVVVIVGEKGRNKVLGEGGMEERGFLRVENSKEVVVGVKEWRVVAIASD